MNTYTLRLLDHSLPLHAYIHSLHIFLPPSFAALLSFSPAVLRDVLARQITTRIANLQSNETLIHQALRLTTRDGQRDGGELRSSNC